MVPGRVLLVVLVSAQGCGRAGFEPGALQDAVAQQDGAPTTDASEHPCATCADGLISHWRFDEGFTITTRDDITMRSGMLVGPAGWAPGIRGGAVALSGAYIEVGDWDLAAELTSGFTVAMWVRQAPERRTFDRFFSSLWYVTPPGNTGTLAFDNGQSGDRLRCYAYIGGGWRTIESAPVLANDTWHHIACVHNGGTLEVFLDGISVGVTAAGGSLGTTEPRPMAFGGSYNGTGNAQNAIYGRLDDARIYDRPLTLAELAALATQ